MTQTSAPKPLEKLMSGGPTMRWENAGRILLTNRLVQRELEVKGVVPGSLVFLLHRHSQEQDSVRLTLRAAKHTICSLAQLLVSEVAASRPVDTGIDVTIEFPDFVAAETGVRLIWPNCEVTAARYSPAHLHTDPVSDMVAIGLRSSRTSPFSELF